MAYLRAVLMVLTLLLFLSLAPLQWLALRRRWLLRLWLPVAFGRTLGNFHRINPGNVRRVAHALALDEERERFEPSYWDPPARAVTSAVQQDARVGLLPAARGW